MNIVDTSGWLEYFSGGPNADKFLEPLQNPASLIVPVITIYEVFKVVLRESHENDALNAIAAMEKGKVVDVTTPLAMAASKLSIQHRLPMADSLILATAQVCNCTIWTQDSDFKGIPGVNFFPKTAGR